MSTVKTISADRQGTRSAQAGKYLTFALGAEEYGLEILKVREIIGYVPVTRVPRMPRYILGVINLRGQVIPVVDFRLRFEMESVERSETTCIIVVEIDDGTERVSTGLVVDEVCEVRDIMTEQIDPTPDFGVQVESDFILGMAKVGEGVKILLDINRVLTATDVAGVVKQATKAKSESEE